MSETLERQALERVGYNGCSVETFHDTFGDEVAADLQGRGLLKLRSLEGRETSDSRLGSRPLIRYYSLTAQGAVAIDLDPAVLETWGQG
jgi:hypothetical protein